MRPAGEIAPINIASISHTMWPFDIKSSVKRMTALRRPASRKERDSPPFHHDLIVDVVVIIVFVRASEIPGGGRRGSSVGRRCSCKTHKSFRNKDRLSERGEELCCFFTVV